MPPTQEHFRKLQRLVDSGNLSAEELDQAWQNCSKYIEGRKENPIWPELGAVAFVEALRPSLSILASAAVLGIEHERAEDICAAASESFGAEFFKFRELEVEVPSGLPVGETLVQMGRVNATQLRQALRLQEAIRDEIGVRLWLGTVLVRNGLITLGDYFQALAIHFGFEDADKIDDELLRRIEMASRRDAGKLG